MVGGGLGVLRMSEREIALREPGILDRFTMPAPRSFARHERDGLSVAVVGSDQERPHLGVSLKPGARQPAVCCYGSPRDCYGRRTLLRRRSKSSSLGDTLSAAQDAATPEGHL